MVLSLVNLISTAEVNILWRHQSYERNWGWVLHEIKLKFHKSQIHKSGIKVDAEFHN